ncbi:hypothetical protein SMZ65_004317 [Cronobacter dublinensis]|nr:hypothetical protein [Cronobacter dublinensis]ELY4410024.1 hypothetical protein [Cronobacter dublinensis]ELY4487565.1 hypothetical protein [Cronobacter dublinensis]
MNEKLMLVLLYINTVFGGCVLKSDYEPAQRIGVNRFRRHDEEITILHSGLLGYLQPGKILLIRRSDGLFWGGRVYDDVFLFLLEDAKPYSIDIYFEYLFSAWRLKQCHSDQDFVTQGELDF